MTSSSIPVTALVQRLRERLPSLLGVYGFGSRVRGTARPDSDLDVAVLVAGYADPLVLWHLAGELVGVAGCPVDLLDLRAASTVMQHQVIATGERWWAADGDAERFELMVLGEKLALDAARAGVLADIERTGRVYGR